MPGGSGGWCHTPRSPQGPLLCRKPKTPWWLHGSINVKGLGDNSISKTQSTLQPKTTCAMSISLQLCSQSHVIWTVCCHEARMEELFQSSGCTPPPARAAPRLPADNRAAGKGYHKNHMTNTGWLQIPVPGNCIQRTNTTSSHAPG